MSDNQVLPPLGENQAAAAAVSALYFALSVGCYLQLKLTNFRLYLLGGAMPGVLRGLSYALCASSISSGSTDVTTAVLISAFQNGGFGLAIAVQLLIIGGWLRNTHPKFQPPAWAPLRMATILLFPCLTVFGPILAVASGLLIYDTATEDSIKAGMRIHRASGLGLFIIACLSLFVAAFTSWWSLRATSWVLSLRTHASNTIVCILPGCLLLVWAASFRVAAIFTHPELVSDEKLVYSLEELPELLQLAMWCIPTLYLRMHLSNGLQQWWKQAHPAGPDLLFGFPRPVEDVAVMV